MAAKELNLRADAQENRDRILVVAREALTVDPDISLNAIAKKAGVGAGTLYRHFPHREALVVAVYKKEIAALVDLVPKLLLDHPPLKAFRLWCDHLAKFGRTKHGIADTLASAISEKEMQAVYGPGLDAVNQLIKACEKSGDIRKGLAALDFLNLVSFLWQLPPDEAGEERAKRLLELVFRGMRA